MIEKLPLRSILAPLLSGDWPDAMGTGAIASTVHANLRLGHYAVAEWPTGETLAGVSAGVLVELRAMERDGLARRVGEKWSWVPQVVEAVQQKELW